MPIIEVKDLVKIYKTGDIELRALDGVTCSIERGEFVCIMGPSGSGKSTMMNILGCLDVLSSGEYILDGVSVRDQNRAALAVTFAIIKSALSFRATIFCRRLTRLKMSKCL